MEEQRLGAAEVAAGVAVVDEHEPPGEGTGLQHHAARGYFDLVEDASDTDDLGRVAPGEQAVAGEAMELGVPPCRL